MWLVNDCLQSSSSCGALIHGRRALRAPHGLADRACCDREPFLNKNVKILRFDSICLLSCFAKHTVSMSSVSIVNTVIHMIHMRVIVVHFQIEIKILSDALGKF